MSSSELTDMNTTTTMTDTCGQELNSICSAKCCDLSSEGPMQSYQKDSFLGSKRLINGSFRHFKEEWLKQYPWLVYCTTRNKAYCFTCSKAYRNKKITFSKKGSDTFIMQNEGTGFDSWNKAGERFKRHQKSDVHREANEKEAKDINNE